MVGLTANAIVYGLTNAATYVLVALGLTLLFGTMRIFFFMHGSLYMIAAMLLTYLGATIGLNLIGSMLLILLVLSVFAIFTSTVIYRRISYTQQGAFVAFLALSIILESLAVVIFGALPQKAPALVRGIIEIFSVSIPLERLIVVPICAILLGLLILFIYRTKIGKALRAIEQNVDSAYVLGIDPNKVNAVVFIVAFVLVGVAGMLMAPVSYVEPYMGTQYLLNAFVIIILGGLGSISGVVVGSIIVGVTESLVSTYIGLDPAMMSIFLLIMAVLIWRPRGIFGRGEL